jgi:hypothetical protein
MKRARRMRTLKTRRETLAILCLDKRINIKNACKPDLSAAKYGEQFCNYASHSTDAT